MAAPTHKINDPSPKNRRMAEARRKLQQLGYIPTPPEQRVGVEQFMKQLGLKSRAEAVQFVKELKAATFVERNGTVILGIKLPHVNESYSVEDLLINHQELCDIEFQLDDGNTFLAHKLILLRATYFQTLLSSGFQESHTTIVVLKEIQSVTFEWIFVICMEQG
eukprot:TRINITY_DN5415_c0_g2_i1.p1 TRINITY_DN5415_c0_g2~~TRINITY_DN5415_c0_g2_i1.p1  ORF type:complete len:164 (-),score=44.25 TRINITY_DN5415_c0_g2_i1:401-892(-)